MRKAQVAARDVLPGDIVLDGLTFDGEVAVEHVAVDANRGTVRIEGSVEGAAEHAGATARLDTTVLVLVPDYQPTLALVSTST